MTHHAEAPSKELLYSVFATFKVGGPQRRFAAIANYFSGKYQHIITATDARYDATELLASDVAWQRQEFPEAKLGLRNSYFPARMLLRKLKPSALVTNNWGAIEWAAANRPQIVRHIHIEDGFGPEEATTQLKRRVWFRRFALGGPSTLVLPSQTLVRIARDVWRIPAAKTRYIPNGIPCAKFARAADPEIVAGLKGDGPVIGTIAALRPEKALHRLIDSFAQVRAAQQCRLAIVGEGGERGALESQVERLGLERDVTFVGHLGQPELILPAFSIFALSSDTEQMPLTVLEAMAAGLPVASVDVGDVRAMVSPANGPFVVARTADALAGAILRMIENPAAMSAIAVANRARAQVEYDEARMFAAYDQMFSGRS